METIAHRGQRLMPASRRASETTRPTAWGRINWRKAHRVVRNLRQRIFRATQRGDLKQVRSLEKLMLRGYAHTARPTTKKKWVVKVDIKGAFDHLP
jgi:RNA-directed DNA polymerase